MRYLTHIFSERKFSKFPSFQIVFEWEDILSRELSIPIATPGEISNMFHRRFENTSLVWLYNRLLPKTGLCLHFIMSADIRKRCWYNKNSIPVIIDFWLEEQQLDAFYSSIENVPLLLVTSKEVYHFLREHDCPVPIEHWALSYSDIYQFDVSKTYDKKYEFAFIGRPDPYFIRFVKHYSEEHAGFTYIMNNGDINDRKYVDNKGISVIVDQGRESYLEMIASTKITCYSTPGIDESKDITDTFNQVTPRVFEMLCNGCQIIGHYTSNPDTEWYNLSSVVPNVETYDDFERVLDSMRASEFDLKAAHKFMSKHYTSVRAKELIEILKKHHITIK